MTFLSSPRAVLGAIGAFVAFAVAMVLLRPPLPIDETRYLTVAWEMWRDGTWLVPHLNGEIYSDKPPLLFWLINLEWSVAGVTGIGARLVAPAFGVASLALTWLLARRLWPEDRGRAGLAAVVLATTGAFLVYGSATMFDTMLGAAVLLAMLSLIALRRHGGTGAVPALGAALVLGGPAYREEILWHQSAGRMVSAFAHQRPFWFVLVLLPFYIWPWGWTRAGLASRAPGRLMAQEPARVVALWAGTAFVAFSLISGKQPHYLVPELPALALLLSGMGVPQEERRLVRLVPLAPTAFLLIVGIAVALGLVPEVVVNGGQETAFGLVAAVAVFLVLLAGALLPAKAAPWLVLSAPLALLMFLLAVSPLLFAGYDPAPIGQILAKSEAKGIANLDSIYHGQFNFAGRLAGPVAHPDGPRELAAWATQHPGGLVVTRNEVTSVTLQVVGHRVFNSKDYVLYRVPESSP